MTFLIKYNSKIGFKLMFVLPVLIIICLFLANFTPDINNSFTLLSLIIWLILFINSLFLSLGGYRLSLDFSTEVKKQKRNGFPIQSLEGFSDVEGSVRTVFASSFLISLSILVSLATFLFAVLLWELIASPVIVDFAVSILKFPLDDQATKDLKTSLQLTIIFVAVGLVFIALGISILLSLPEKPSLQPGALMKYYYPSRIPSQIDNFLGDTIGAFLDPITRMRWDEWTQIIAKGLSDAYLPESSFSDRLSSAREKILLFTYLHQTIPNVVSFEIVSSELSEIFKERASFENFLAGKESGISWEILMDIITELRKEAPEIFTVIDRLVIELRDNLRNFKESDLWVTIASPDKVRGNLRPFRIMVFVLNKSEEFKNKKRPVDVKLTNYDLGMNSTLPDTYSIHLDESSDFSIKADALPLISRGEEDIVGYLSRILSIGDAIWFQIYKSRFGFHIYNIRIEEPGKGAVSGTSIKIPIVRDMNFYLQSYGGKIFALVGALIPLIAGGLTLLI